METYEIIRYHDGNDRFITLDRGEVVGRTLVVRVNNSSSQAEFTFADCLAVGVIDEGSWLQRSSGHKPQDHQMFFRVTDSNLERWYRQKHEVVGDPQCYAVFTTDQLFFVLTPSSPRIAIGPIAETPGPFDDGLPVRDGRHFPILEPERPFRLYDPTRPADIPLPGPGDEWNRAGACIERLTVYNGCVGVDLTIGGRSALLFAVAPTLRFDLSPPDEATRLRLSGSIRPQQTFYELGNSRLVHWYRWQTLGIYDDRAAEHYVILGQNGVLEFVDRWSLQLTFEDETAA